MLWRDEALVRRKIGLVERKDKDDVAERRKKEDSQALCNLQDWGGCAAPAALLLQLARPVTHGLTS